MSEDEIKHKGLYPKFVVKRHNGERVNDPLFVLLPEKDLSARHALLQYADHVKSKNPVLAEDIYRWIDNMPILE